MFSLQQAIMKELNCPMCLSPLSLASLEQIWRGPDFEHRLTYYCHLNLLLQSEPLGQHAERFKIFDIECKIQRDNCARDLLDTRTLNIEGSYPSGPFTFRSFRTAADNVVSLVEPAWNPRYWWVRIPPAPPLSSFRKPSESRTRGGLNS